MDYLFLDDERRPQNITWTYIGPGPWIIVRSYEQFINHILTYGVPAKVSFDHDLSDQHYQAFLSGSNDYGTEKTGYDAAKWLVNYCLNNDFVFPQYTIHSMNPIGAKNITSYIENAIKHGGLKT